MIRVPKVFHSIWLGDKPLPATFARFQQSWLDRNPGWVLRFWTEDNLPGDLTRREVYETLRVPAERSDILRLELLFREGGVYIDTDLECLRAIDDLIDGLDCFLGDLRHGRVQNAFVGSIPGHPLLARALREIQPRRFNGYDKAATGPVFLNRFVHEFPDVAIFEPAVIYPTSPIEESRAYARHWAARSWHTPDELAKDVERAEDRFRYAQRQLYDARSALLKISAAPDLASVRLEADRALSMLALDALDASIASTSLARRWWRRLQKWAIVGRVARTLRRRSAQRVGDQA